MPGDLGLEVRLVLLEPREILLEAGAPDRRAARARVRRRWVQVWGASTWLGLLAGFVAYKRACGQSAAAWGLAAGSITFGRTRPENLLEPVVLLLALARRH